jgi:DNA-binding beta-propeller fold protein YncE
LRSGARAAEKVRPFVTRLLVTSASGANGDGYGAILGFTQQGVTEGPFSLDPRIVDPRGLCLDPAGELVYVNSGDDRVLALDRQGDVVLDSGRIEGLDPGGAKFAPDGRYCVTLRRHGTVVAFPASLDGGGLPLLPDGAVPYPRGFGFSPDGTLYLSSGVAPSGEGENTIAVFDQTGRLRTSHLVNDAELSPLDLVLAPNDNIVVSSESPFGARDAIVSVREYEPTGRLVRVLSPDRAIRFTRPRGLRFGPDDRLYCVGADHVVVFDFLSGTFVGAVARLQRLNGQAIVLVP